MCDIANAIQLLNGTLINSHFKKSHQSVQSSPVTDIANYLNNYRGRNYDVAFSASNLSSPNDFSSNDLLAIKHLSVSTNTLFNDWLLSPAGQLSTGALLSQIPTNLTLESLTSKEFTTFLGGNGASPVSELWNLLVTELRISGQSVRQGIQVVASKLIAGKRPGLVPITDSFVRTELGISGWNNAWTCYHRILRDKQVAVLISSLRTSVASSGPFTSGVNPWQLSNARILDLAAWCFHDRRLK